MVRRYRADMGVDSWPTGNSAGHRAEGHLGGGPAGGRPVPGRTSGEYAGAPRRAHPGTRPRPAPGPQPASARHRVVRATPRRQSGGPLGDHRGLTGAGALVLLLAFGILGAVLDRLLGHELWVMFSVCFLAAVLINALRIHLEDLAASIVLVPLAYAAVGGLISLAAGVGSGEALKQQVARAAGVLVFGAPILLLAVIVAAAIATARGRAATLARQRARTRAARRYGMTPGKRRRTR
jgi:hypothetical protein